ncbi:MULTISPECIES: serine hydrolase [unclassified Duganella]|uniref:serine hydrolase domain-containing protein n=1 Tax=unclassified Duganella TaxID=2636909 RepID=UPI001E2F5843|nr:MULTISPECIES: serine hydrolase domain-containing protein [unclassified Duganella]
MNIPFQLTSLALLGLLQSSIALAAAPDAVRTGKLDADAPLLSGHGTQLTGALDWSVRREAGMTVLDAPELDAALALIEVDAPNAAAALKAAWSRFRPGVKRVAASLTREPAREGWDERVAAGYELPANERRVANAVALRSGGKWTVVALDGGVATVQKRGAALEMMRGSVHPPGYKPESFAGRQPHPLDAARIARLRAFVADGIRQLRIPGAALALLDHGQVVYEGGVGVRRHGRPEPVDADTLFMAASNTKGMTTLLLASLADEGKLRWEQPVTELYPSFRLGDADTTARVRFKHLVCACTGLPQQNLEMMFEFGQASPASSIGLLANMKPTSNFGELYQYSNLMASAAGYIGGALAHPGMELGAAYDRAMQERIFTPLGMRGTTFDMARATGGNHASPHTIDYSNQLRVTGTEMDSSIVPHRPAGGAWTSAHDFIRYVQLEANQGRLEDGRQLVSSANLLARRAPQVAAGDDTSYGMGLEVMKVNGVQVIDHGGSLPGFKSNFYLLPEAGVGAVLMLNADEGYALLPVFQRYLLEVLYDGKPEALEDLRLAAAASRSGHAAGRARYTVPAAPAVASRLASRYHSDELGELVVSRRGKQTFVDAGEWKTAVATHANADGTVSLLTITPGLDFFELVVGSKDSKRTLTLHDGQREYLFTEM